MDKKKLVLQELKKLTEPERFADVIYKNFIELAEKPQLQHTRQEIIRLLTDTSMGGYVLYSDRMAIGYLVGETKNLNDGRLVFYISYIYVSPKYRNHKLGSYLLEKIIMKIKSIGINFILLTYDVTDKILVKFYNKYKFIVDPVLRNGGRHEVFTLYL